MIDITDETQKIYIVMVLVKTSIVLSLSLIYKPQTNFTACKDKKTIREMEKINVFKNNLQLYHS